MTKYTFIYGIEPKCPWYSSYKLWHTMEFPIVWNAGCVQPWTPVQWVSESRSVISESLDPMDYTVHEILQARIPERVAFPFFRGSSQPRDRAQVSHTAGGFFTSWAIREAQIQLSTDRQVEEQWLRKSLCENHTKAETEMRTCVKVMTWEISPGSTLCGWGGERKG